MNKGLYIEQTTQHTEKYLQSIISLTYRKTPYGNREFFYSYTVYTIQSYLT